MNVEIRPTFSHMGTVEAGTDFLASNAELRSNFSKESAIEAGFKVAGAAIISIGLYKLITAESVADLLIGGAFVYVGYKIFKHKSK